MASPTRKQRLRPKRSVSLPPGIMSAAITRRNSVIATCTPCTVVSRSRLMSLIMTFMLEPAKLQMNCARARGTRVRRRPAAVPADTAALTASTLSPGRTLGSVRWRRPTAQDWKRNPSRTQLPRIFAFSAANSASVRTPASRSSPSCFSCPSRSGGGAAGGGAAAGVAPPVAGAGLHSAGRPGLPNGRPGAATPGSTPRSPSRR